MSNITAFLDHFDKDFESQLNLAIKTGIKHISMRFFGDKQLKDLTIDEIKTYQSILKKHKMGISMLDAKLDYHIIQYDKSQLDSVVNNAELLQAKILLMDLPKLDDFDLQHDLLIAFVKSVLEDNKKKHFQIVFKMNDTYKPGVLAFLINSIKSIKFQFDCGHLINLQASVTTTYRIMKKNIESILVYDVDKDKESSLLGYGNTGIIDILQKMKRDDFKGYALIDTNLIEYLNHRNDQKPKKRFFGLFSKNKKQVAKYQKNDAILKLNEESHFDYESLIEVYKSVLEKILQ